MLRQFLVHIDPAESNTPRASDRDIESLLGRMGTPSPSISFINQNADLVKAVAQSRVGVELWSYFVAVALALALMESLVARTSKHEIGTTRPEPGTA